MALSQLLVLLSHFKTKAFELKMIVFRFVTALINTHHFWSIEKEGLNFEQVCRLEEWGFPYHIKQNNYNNNSNNNNIVYLDTLSFKAQWSLWGHVQINLNQMQVFEERGKPEDLGKNLSEQRREPF